MRVAEKAVAPMSSEIAADLEQAARALLGASQVALACHISPDGDALGSMLGFHHMLVAAGRQSVASFSNPFVVAPHYRQIPGIDLLTPPGEFPSEPDVMVTFDSGSITRLGDLEPSAKAARELIVVDHHVKAVAFAMRPYRTDRSPVAFALRIVLGVVYNVSDVCWLAHNVLLLRLGMPPGLAALWRSAEIPTRRAQAFF